MPEGEACARRGRAQRTHLIADGSTHKTTISTTCESDQGLGCSANPQLPGMQPLLPGLRTSNGATKGLIVVVVRVVHSDRRPATTNRRPAPTWLFVINARKTREGAAQRCRNVEDRVKGGPNVCNSELLLLAGRHKCY